MIKRKLSLRSRIFFFMIMLVVVASILIAAVTIIQYKDQSQDYHRQRLERKEAQLISSIDYVLKETTLEVKTENLFLIFKDKIYDIANIHNVSFNLFDLKGNLVKKSRPSGNENIIIDNYLSDDVLTQLNLSASKRYVEKNKYLGGDYRSSYIIINDRDATPLGILNVPYFDDDSLNYGELNEFLIRLSYAYVIMILVAILFAYFVSKYITKSLQTIRDRMKGTSLEKNNQKIELEGASLEVSALVDSYNSMIDDLEDSAKKLASSEREQALREMAKQVAHEIKNPLTPMRLSVQSFQQKFDPDDPKIHKKVEEYSKTLIQQIDTMSSIASAFSNFAKMPAQKLELLNIVEAIELTLEIFPESDIKFIPQGSNISVNFDRSQLIRIITNLVKNAIQSIPPKRTPKISIVVSSDDLEVIIVVKDNGSGVTDSIEGKIFEPRFTTKSSGMGLGLPMIKNIIETYNGSISFSSIIGEGSEFTIRFPKNN